LSEILHSKQKKKVCLLLSKKLEKLSMPTLLLVDQDHLDMDLLKWKQLTVPKKQLN